MLERHTHVLIIGGGPGGYVAGIRAGQLGLEALLVDGQPMGGTCLNVGCIPSKALLHVAEEFATATEQAASAPLGVSVSDPSVDLTKAVAWKDQIVHRLNDGVGSLLAKAGTSVVEGWATVINGKTVEVQGADGFQQRITADHLIIATGSQPIELPNLSYSERVISSTEALTLTEVPERLAVIGGGYIGLELGMAFAKFGSHVVVVEAEDRILSTYDKALTDPVADRMAELGMELKLSTQAKAVEGNALLVTGPNGDEAVTADKILVTVGRRPVVVGTGVEHLGLTMNGPFLAVDERCQTSMRDVWAIGDVTGEPMLAHRAMKQGEVAAEAIAGHNSVFDPMAIPAIVFTDPEIVTAGLSPEQAAAEGDEVIVGRFPLQANGRSLTLDANRGFVRTVARADDHQIVGLAAVGSEVAELSTAFGLALEMGARLEDIADTIHAHPTIGEGLAESALAALGHALHI